MENPPQLASCSEEQRQNAMDKFKIIKPYLSDEKTLNTIVKESGISTRTLRHWISKLPAIWIKRFDSRKSW